MSEQERWKQFCDAWLIIGGFNILVTALSKAHAREKGYPVGDLPYVIQGNINTYCKCAFDWMPVGESVVEDE